MGWPLKSLLIQSPLTIQFFELILNDWIVNGRLFANEWMHSLKTIRSVLNGPSGITAVN